MFRLPSEPLRRLTRSLQTVTVAQAGSQQIRLAAEEAGLQISEEHPSVDRMSDDWGAICEVFKQSAYYYVSIAGVRLRAGDAITLEYADGREPLTLRVLELEDGRARIADPGRV